MTLTELTQLFRNSGLKGPVIQDKELQELGKRLTELADYFQYRNDSTMRASIIREREAVNRMIEARKH